MMAREFSCTSEVGIPFVKEAIRSSEAVIMDTVFASMGVKLVIPLPAALTTLYPNIELPIPKKGAIISVAKIMINCIRLWSVGSIFISLETIESNGPVALATLFEPILKAT